MFYGDLCCLVIAGDRQVWRRCGSALLDQLETNEECLLPVKGDLLRMSWEGN